MAEMRAPVPSRGFVAASWAFVVYLVGVILFGAWVRITHSGAGCGDHWPDCNGQIIPLSPSTETLIEFSHRLTSGLCGVLILLLLLWAWRLFGRHHRVFWGCVVTLLFVIFEGAIGAGLVLGELVADDDSVARAVVIALHLVNTLVLTGSAALTSWWAAGAPRPSWRRAEVSRALRWLLPLGLLGIVVTSMTGAVTALGDTLFPVDPTLGGGLIERVREGLTPANHFLVRLRVVHPVIAVTIAFFLLVISELLRNQIEARGAVRWSWVLSALVLGECVLGGVNVLLHAPGWIQLAHLALAQAVWVAAVLMVAEVFRPTRGTPGA